MTFVIYIYGQTSQFLHYVGKARADEALEDTIYKPYPQYILHVCTYTLNTQNQVLECTQMVMCVLGPIIIALIMPVRSHDWEINLYPLEFLPMCMISTITKF